MASTRLLLTALAVLVGAAVLVAWLVRRGWRAGGESEVRALDAAAGGAPRGCYAGAELDGLPAPVARYFRSALRDGQPLVRHARIRWRGEFNMGTAARAAWKEFSAVQDFVPGAPGFVWEARIRMAPGVPVLVRDGFVAGQGSMRAAILGLFTVAETRGTPAIAAAALQRYLGEAAWFPTALLPSQGVRWTALDASRARAEIEASGTRVALEFRFRQDGLIAEVFAPDRGFDDGRHPPVPRPWTARHLAYEERQGMKVPSDSVAEWQLPEGVFEYWRGRPEEVAVDLESVS